MKRFVVLVACALVTFACQKKPAEPAAEAPAAQPAAAAPAEATPAPAAAPAETAPVVITEDLVAKYIEYEKENIRLATEFAEQARKNLKAAEGSTVKTLNTIGLTDDMSKAMEEKLAAKRRALGLGDAEFEAVKDAAATLANGRMLYNQMGGDAQLAKMEAEMKQQVAAVPADQRAAAEAEMAKVTQGLKDMRDGADVRKKYGDASADAMLKYADVLARQRLEALGAMAGKK